MPKTTRDKIKYRVDQLGAQIDQFQQYLFELHEMAQGRSVPLNESIPTLLELTEVVQDLVKKLRERV